MKNTNPAPILLVIALSLSSLYNSMAADINFTVSPSSLSPVDITGTISRSPATKRKTVCGIASGGQFGSASGILAGGEFPTNIIQGEYCIEPNATSFSFVSGGIFIPDANGNGSENNLLPQWSFTYERKLFYITSEIESTIWLGEETFFSTNVEADWYVLGTKRHRGRTFKIGKHWAPEVPMVYPIIAKEPNSDCKATALLTVVRASTLSVDATDASHTKIFYKLEPSSITCEASLKIGPYNKISKNVSDIFHFDFDQTQLSLDTSFDLELSNSSLSKKVLSESLTVDFVDVHDTNTLFAWIAIEGVGLRTFSWSATDYYKRYTYSCPSSGELIRFTPKNSKDVATSNAFMSFQNMGPNDGDYLLAFSHRFSDEQSLLYLDKHLSNLASYWKCLGKDFTANKSKSIYAFIEAYLTPRSDNSPALTIDGGTQIKLQIQ